MNIFVTGGTGFIGKCLINRLRNINCNIYAIDRKEKYKSLKSNSINWIPKGLEDLNLDDLKNIHTIIHLAAVGVSPQKASKIDLEFFNVYQSLRLIKLADEAKLYGVICSPLEIKKIKNIAPSLKCFTPGIRNSEIKNDQKRSNSVYSGLNPLVGDDIAKVISYVIDCPENVNISDITVLAKSQASSTVLNRK